MKRTALTQSSKMREIAKETIFDQRGLLVSIRRTAWWLYGHEMRNGYSAYEALDHVLKWMAEQAEMLERVKQEPTQMQRQLLQMLVDGKSQKQISLELGINSRTIRTHLSRMRSRIGAETVYQVIAIATKKGWVKWHRTEHELRRI